MPKTGTIEINAQQKSRGGPQQKGLIEQIWQGLRLFKVMLYDPAYRFPARLKIMGVVMALYLISPIDIIPDVFPIIGFADDTALFLGVFWMLVSEIKDYAKRIEKT